MVVRTPSLAGLDPLRLRGMRLLPPRSTQLLPPRSVHLLPLRSTHLADLKNDRMMSLLRATDWWTAYRKRLDRHREFGEPAPKYPAQVEDVERRVDALLRAVVDPSYKR